MHSIEFKPNLNILSRHTWIYISIHSPLQFWWSFPFPHSWIEHYTGSFTCAILLWHSTVTSCFNFNQYIPLTDKHTSCLSQYIIQHESITIIFKTFHQHQRFSLQVLTLLILFHINTLYSFLSFIDVYIETLFTISSLWIINLYIYVFNLNDANCILWHWTLGSLVCIISCAMLNRQIYQKFIDLVWKKITYVCYVVEDKLSCKY